MRKTAIMMTWLLGATTVIGTAQAGDIIDTGFCRSFENRVGQLCRQHENSCDRVQASFAAACGDAGTIYTSTSTVDSPALALLREDYNVVTVDGVLPTPLQAGHVVVSAADLDDPVFADLLTFARDFGQTIAIVDAFQDEVDSFANRFGGSNGANCVAPFDTSTIELYGLQDTMARRGALSSSYCLVGLSGLSREVELSTRLWLRERFALSAPEPTPGIEPVTLSADDSVNIVELATAVHCSFSNPNGPDDTGIAQDVYVTGARSFINAQDIYYIQNELQYTQGTSTAQNYGYEVDQFGATGVLDFSSGLSQSQPATTTAFESSFSNSSSTTESGSVGFNAEGPTATVGGSATQGQTVTYSIPPTTILNQSVNPLPAWDFNRQSSSGQTYGPNTSWLWTVPWDAYADQGEGTTGRIVFTSRMSLGDITDFVPTSWSVPYPFGGITEVGAPTITGVSPETVAQGQRFTITGAELYPGLVNDVLLQGISVSDNNFTTNGETAPGSGLFTVTVIVPGTQGTGNNTVVVQQEFNDNAQFTPGDTSIDVTAAE